MRTNAICVAILIVGVLAGCGVMERATPIEAADSVKPKPLPALKGWELNMKQYGAQTAQFWRDATGWIGDAALAHTYYDELRVLYQIADYTKQPIPPAVLAGVLKAYRDDYVFRSKGNVPGYWSFTTGLRLHYQATKDERSKAAILALRDHATYSSPTVPLEWMKGAITSREVAYAILGYINAEAVGAPKSAHRKVLVGLAYDHLKQIVDESWRKNPKALHRATKPEDVPEQASPFMVALTAHSLIRDWEETKDPRLVPALRTIADYLWAKTRHPNGDTLYYDLVQVARKDPEWDVPAYDLNLLIAPMYAFLFKETGDIKYRDQGDKLFAAGVVHAYLDGAKQFNQNYWWSFDYVRWRRGN